MPDTIVDFGGFTVDVSKIREFEDVHVEPQCFVRFDCPAGLGAGFFAGQLLGDRLRRAYEAYRAKQSKPDGWYWATNYSGTKRLIRIKDNRVETHWGEGSNPLVCHCEWAKYEPADPMSAEFMDAIKFGGCGDEPEL